jgi:hypothetical protein
MKRCIKENGNIIKQMGKEFTYTKTAQNTKVIGKMIYKMVLVRKYGLMELFMKGKPLILKQ